MTMRIAILGTRGIPNNYGGFERLAEQLSYRLVEKGNTVFVYNSHTHYYQEKKWNDVNIIHCFDPEYIAGTCGQFIYDLNCILDARKRNFDVILMLGYTSSSIWHALLPSKSTIIYNMDGMEWKRAKYSALTKTFLMLAEKMAAKKSNFFVTDSPAIQKYFFKKYKLPSEHIAYGAEQFITEDENVLNEFDVLRKQYLLLIARMEPENNIETILEGFSISSTNKKFIVVGNTANAFGKYLVKKFTYDKRIVFARSIYDLKKLHSLRFFSYLYFHGHSTGGTNPSLLEAMSGKALIVAHDNVFNRSVLENDAFYFTSGFHVKCFIDQPITENSTQKMIDNNFKKIQEIYNWQQITLQYEQVYVAMFIHSNQ